MKTIIWKDESIKIANDNKAYALVYEKAYSQSSACHRDELDELSLKYYEDAFNKVYSRAVELSDEFYDRNVKIFHDDIFDVECIIVDYCDYVESVTVLEFDIDLADFEVQDITYAYVIKNKNSRFVSDRKKSLIIETENNEFEYNY